MFNVGQHFGRHLAAALNDPEDRRLFLLRRATCARGLQSVAPPRAAFFSNGFRDSLVAGGHINLADLDFARQGDGERWLRRVRCLEASFTIPGVHASP